MAKLNLGPTLQEIVKETVYAVSSLIYPTEITNRLYFDLKPVPEDMYGRAEKEFEECKITRTLR